MSNLAELSRVEPSPDPFLYSPVRPAAAPRLALDPVDVEALRTPRERSLRRVAKVVSALAWLVLLVSIVGAVYGILIAAAIAVSHALFMAHVRGNGVRLGPDQLPELWAKVETASHRLGLREAPETYVLESGGVLNAMATRLLGRRFVILNSNLIDACLREQNDDAEVGEIDFVIAHEIGHLAAGHLSWLLLPARAVPLLGPAYSRACEYTCDRIGHAIAGDLERSQRALAILAGGEHAGRRIDLEAFAVQHAASRGFWMDIYELNASHPFLSRRMAALRSFAGAGGALDGKRRLISYPLAPIFGVAMGGAASSAMVAVAMIAVLAAIAIPAFKKYVDRSRATSQRIEAPVTSSEGTSPTKAVVGDRYVWRMTMPSNAWQVLPDAEARRQNPSVDRWMRRADVDAHVMVVGEQTGGRAIKPSAFVQAVVQNLRASGSGMRVLDESPLGRGRLLRAEVTTGGMRLRYLFGLFSDKTVAYQVVAFAPVEAMPKVEAELRSALASFEAGDAP